MKIDLPVIINGKKIMDGERHEFRYESDFTVTIPKVTETMLQEINEVNSKAVHDMTVSDISEFLGRVGDLWRNENYSVRQECVKYTSMATGYSEEMINFDMYNIPELLVRPYIGDMLDMELGDRNRLDEWERRGSSLIHCEPLGKMLHIMVGNVPIASIYSLLRGIITKNANIIKLPRRDLITCMYFCYSLIDADPDSPITKALSVLTWIGGQDSVEDKLINMSDAICVWGSEAAVAAIRSKITYGKKLLEYGPRRSLQIIGEVITDAERREAARGTAFDICMYDQEACFSTQIIYIKGSAEKFAQDLAEELRHFKYPKGYTSADHQASVQIVRKNAIFEGNKVIAPDDTEWTIVIMNKVTLIESHPLSRTVFIMPIQDYDEILPFVSRATQTVAVYPEKLRYEIRDRFTLKGVDRVVESGKAWEPRLGSSHDGTNALHDMVRWVCMDRESNYQSRYYDPVRYFRG